MPLGTKCCCVDVTAHTHRPKCACTTCSMLDTATASIALHRPEEGLSSRKDLSLHWEKQLLACIHRPALFGNGNSYLIGKINEAAIVGGGGCLSKAHVDEVCLVLQDCDESPCQPCARLHSTQSRVPNLAGDQLSSCTSAATCRGTVAFKLWSLPPWRCPLLANTNSKWA